jgi:hypothetical protein
MVQMTLPALKPTGFESDYEDLAAQLKRRRLQAAALANQDLGLGAQMVSGHLVGGGWLEALGKIAQAGIGGYNQKLLDDEERTLNQQKQDEFEQLAKTFPKATPGAPATKNVTAMDDQGNVMPDVTPALLPKKPGVDEYMAYAAKLAKFGPMGQAAAGHIMNRVMDAELPTKPTNAEWSRGPDVAGADGKPVATWVAKHDPKIVVHGDEPVYQKPSELAEKTEQIFKAYKASMPGAPDSALRTTAELVATGNWEVTPPNDRGEVALVNKLSRIKMQVPGLSMASGAAPPVPQQQTPLPPAAAAPPPPLVPQPPQDLRQMEDNPPPLIPTAPGQAATPPLIPQPNIQNNVVNGVPFQSNITGSPKQQAEASAVAAKEVVANKPLSAMTAEEKWAKYGGHSGNLDYLEPKPVPGIDIAGGVPGARQSERMNNALVKINEAREKKALGEQEQIMKEFDAAVTQVWTDSPDKGVYLGKDGEWTGAAPGQGYGKFNPLKDKPTQAMTQAKQALDNILIKARSGSAVSAQEADRIGSEVGSAFLQGPEVFWQAIKNTRARIEAANREVLRPYPPIVRDAWKETRTGGFSVGAGR